MGLYDRDYYRSSNSNSWNSRRRPRWMLTTWIILINVALFLVNGFFFQENYLTGLLSMHSWTLTEPLYWFEFLTYGFVQSPDSIWHIFGNMLGLFFFGRPIEQRYGRNAFLGFYLGTILVCGLAWGIANYSPDNFGGGMLGASGGVTGLVILFALNYPRSIVLLWGVIPMPVWVLGIILVAYDALGTMNQDSNIAHSVHLYGVACALVYFYYAGPINRFFRKIGNFFKHLFSSDNRGNKSRGNRLNRNYGTYDSSNNSRQYPLFQNQYGQNQYDRDGNSENRSLGMSEIDPMLVEEVDRILKKISESGDSSLSRQERETLQRASEEYQRIHRKKKEN